MTCPHCRSNNIAFLEVQREERKGYDYKEMIYNEFYTCRACEKNSMRTATFTTLVKV